MTQRVLKKDIVLCKIPLEPSPSFSFQGVATSTQFEFSPYQKAVEQNNPKEQADRKLDEGKRSPRSNQFYLNSTDGQKSKLRQDFQSKIHRFLYSKNSEDVFIRPQITSTASKQQTQQTNQIRSSAQKFNIKNAKGQRDSSKNTNSSMISKGRSGENSQMGEHQIKKNIMGRYEKSGKGPNSPLSLKKGPQNFSQQALYEGQQRLQSGRLSTRVAQSYGLNKYNPLRQSQAVPSRNQMTLAKKDSSQDRLETRDSTHDKIDLQRKRFGKKGNNQHQKQEERQLQTFSPSNAQERSSLAGKPHKHYSQQEQYKDLEFFHKQLTDRYKEIALPAQVVTLVLMFNAHELPKLLRLSASWHTVINEALEQYTLQWENKFIKEYGQYLVFTKSYFSTTSISFCSEKGIRLDRVFQCEIIQNMDMINKTVKVGYDFSYLNKGNQRYHCEHRFDVIRSKLPRVTWIHQSHDLPPYSQNEIQMAPGDTIELAVSILNLNGLINLETFKWEAIENFDIPKNDRDALNYDRDIKILFNQNDRKTKVHCNTNRICEVEDAVPEWLVAGKGFREQPKLPIDTSKYLSSFNVLQVQFNELDQHYNKIVLQAKERGVVDTEVLNDTLLVHIISQNDPVQNEIRQKGMMFDRNKKKDKVQLRVGDILVVYNTLHMPQDLQPKIVFPESLYASKASSTTPYKGGESQYATQQSKNL